MSSADNLIFPSLVVWIGVGEHSLLFVPFIAPITCLYVSAS